MLIKQIILYFTLILIIYIPKNESQIFNSVGHMRILVNSSINLTREIENYLDMSDKSNEQTEK